MRRAPWSRQLRSSCPSCVSPSHIEPSHVSVHFGAPLESEQNDGSCFARQRIEALGVSKLSADELIPPEYDFSSMIV